MRDKLLEIEIRVRRFMDRCLAWLERILRPQ